MIKVKQFVTENKEKIAIVAGVAAVGVLAYWIFKKFKGQNETSTPVPHAQQPATAGSISSDHSQKTSKSENLAETYDSKFAKIVNQTRTVLDSNHGELNPDVIRCIIRGQYILANQDIKSLIYKSRKQRRSIFQDHLEYAKILTKIQLQLQQIQQKHLGAILARFNIDKATWKDVCAAWQMSQNQSHQQGQEQQEGFSDLIRDEQQKQLLSLRIPNSKPKQFVALQDILRFKIKSLQVVNPSELGLDLAVDNASRYDMIETYINDIVFKQFNVEEEEVQYSIQQLSKFQKEKISKYEEKIGELMEKFIDGEEQDQESNFY